MAEQQVAHSVLMIRPAVFHSNPQTVSSNHFQTLSTPAGSELLKRAQLEFDGAVQVLRGSGVDVIDLQDTSSPEKPDAIFPNNWFSTHADGTVVLYPMLAANRRTERRGDLLATLRTRGFSIARTEDLTQWERSGVFLEGTGSLVLDRVNRVAYACISPRTCTRALEDFVARLQYRPIMFHAADQQGRAIYHTNVVLSIGRRFAAVCLECMGDSDADVLQAQMTMSGHEIIELSLDQVAQFAGNMLELATLSGARVALSQSAVESLTSRQRSRLEKLSGPLLTADLSTIERHGGGSFRCMLAEIHLPRA